MSRLGCLHRKRSKSGDLVAYVTHQISHAFSDSVGDCSVYIQLRQIANSSTALQVCATLSLSNRGDGN